MACKTCTTTAGLRSLLKGVAWGQFVFGDAVNKACGCGQTVCFEAWVGYKFKRLTLAVTAQGQFVVLLPVKCRVREVTYKGIFNYILQPEGNIRTGVQKGEMYNFLIEGDLPDDDPAPDLYDGWIMFDGKPLTESDLVIGDNHD